MELNDIFNEIIGTTKQTFEILQKGGVDVISIYMFYYYTAKWQKTNQPHCTVSFICNGLSISEARVKKARKYLIEKGLIEDIQKRKTDGVGFSKVYTKINYIFTNKYIENLSYGGGMISGGAEICPPQNHTPNALSSYNKMLEEKKENILCDLENYLKLWNDIFDKSYQLTDDLKNAYISVRKKYTSEQINLASQNYYDTRVKKRKKEERQQYELHIYKFLKQKNGFITYL